MSDRSRSVLDRLMSRGEEVFTQVSNELMMNPRFIQAMQSAMKGKETIDFAVTQALKTMNVPTRTEFKRTQSRLESVENELRELRDELRRTRAQAARASVAARTATRSTPASGVSSSGPGTKKAGATRQAAASGRKTTARRKKPATPVIVVTGIGTPDE